ncbi:MAG: VanZ family protein [Erysipelotrichaceae bacterium]|jgi:glycopeptide antibiotics resistance protein|nr:VanZ family protein [Erysipelotrichaceae bacterium]
MIKLKVLKNIFLAYMIFLVYVMVVYQRQIDFSWIVTGGFSRLNFLMSDTTNFQLFATVNRYLAVLDRPSGFGLFLYNIIGNMVILIPFGYLFPIVNKSVRKWWIFFLVALAFILMMEMMQYFSMSGTLDVDDVLLNLMGALIGYILCPIKTTPVKQTIEL